MALKTRFTALLAALFGRFSWQAPSWANALGRFLRANVRVLLGLAAIAAIAAGAYRYVTTRPPPPDQITLSAALTAPSVPPRRLKSEPVPAPAPVVIEFNGSAAPLDAIHKKVDVNVSIRPATEGSFEWASERTLVFTPKNAWPIGEKYTVVMTQALVNRPNVVLETKELRFETETFKGELTRFEFYQDPVDPAVKQVVGTFRFNYPVDAPGFEKHIELSIAPVSNLKQTSKTQYTVSYDDLRFEAYVRSESLPLPVEDHTATLTLRDGANAIGSNRALTVALTSTATVPGKGSKFRVQQANASLATNAAGDPDQVLIFSCTSPVNETVFAAAVKVWALPKDKPAEKGVEAQKNYGWSATEVGNDLLKKLPRVALTAVPGEREIGEVQSFKYDAKPGTTLFVRVEAGIEAYGGYSLLKSYEATVQVPEYPREIKIAHEGAVLSVSGEKKLTVSARGIPAFKVTLSRIQPKDLNHLITQSSGDFAHINVRSYNFNAENISEVFSEIHQLDASNPRVAQYDAIDFTPHFKEGADQRGMFFVKVEAWNPVTNQPMNLYSRSDEEAPPREPGGDAVEAVGDADAAPNDGSEEPERSEGEGGEGGGDGEYRGQLNDERFVLLTDLGVIEKLDVAQNHWVYVQSFRTGGPVAGAQVEVLAKNGLVILKQTTDANGATTLPSLVDFTAEKTPVALVVRRDADVSFLPLNRYDRSLSFSAFDTGGVRTKGKAAALSAYAFTDRGLYRPGETAHLASLVRAVDWSKSVAGTPLVLSVIDPRGLAVAKHPVKLDATGLVSIDFKPEENAPTGTYSFTVAVPREKLGDVQLGSTPFRVEEFLPDQMRLTTRFESPSPGWVNASKVKAIAELRNLFGTPAADHRVTANVTLTPYAPRFGKYPEHQFFDPSRAQRSESRELDETTTDTQGNAEFEIDLTAWAPATWTVSIYAEGFELGGGRGVSSVATAIVSPRKFMLGFKADGDLSFIKRNVERKVQLIAVDPALTMIAVEKLKAVLVEQRYVSVLTKTSNGSYQYQSVLKDVTRKTTAFKVDAAGTTVTMPSAEAGTFYWSIRDAEDVELVRVPFTIAGEANVAKELEKNAELKISLDKAEYEPGETISVQITAPYAGAGVITIERDKVLVHKPFKTSTSSTVQTIAVPAGLEVTGYVNVAFVRSIDSPELYVSPLSYGVVPFKVLKKSQHLELTVTSPELTRPGRPMAITYKTDQPAKVVLFAIDEGILQVARYETPGPLAFFLEKRALEVGTRQIVDLLLPEFKLVKNGKGGGDSDAALARNLNPFKRKADAPAVFWSGILDSGPEAKTVSFTVPESFNGSLRVMAVAASAQALAATKTKTTVRGPFVISPNTPMFVSPGDTFVVSAAIANNVEGSGDRAEVTVTMKPNAGFAMASSAQAVQKLVIGEKREGAVSFDVKATDVLGDGTLEFQVSGAKQEATRTAHVSVRPSSAYLVTTQTGSVKDSSVELASKRTMFEELATRHVTVSLLPLGLSSGLIDYLETYPHLCTEQLTSRAVPALVLMKRPEWGYSAAHSKAAFERAFSTLRARQNDQGQFGYWAANSFNVDTLDVFITLMLTEAKERGAASPNDVRLKAIENLKQAQVPVASITQARLRAQTLYVLARNAVVAPAPTAQLAEFLGRQKNAANDIATAFLAATYQLTNNPGKAQELINSFDLNADVVNEPDTYTDNTVYRAQALYLVAKHFPARLDTMGAKVLTMLTKTMSTSGLHSLGASWSLYALDAYSTALEKSPNGTLKNVNLEFKDQSGAFKKQDLAGSLTSKSFFTSAATGFKITSREGALVFYSVTESGFDKAAPVTALSEGVEVLHTFEDSKGKPVMKVALGDEINVHLRTRSLTKDQTLYNMAVVDLLPSGFEVVLNRGSDQQGLARLVNEGSDWRPELDIREDRVNFYGAVEPSVRQVTYKIKAIAKGTFVVPPAQAVGLYQPGIRARSAGSTITVE